MRTLRVLIVSAAMLVCTVIGIAQTSEPTPVTLSPQPTAAPAATDAEKEQAEMAANIKELQELKAQNEEILKQQQAALEQLDDLQKEAEQLRVFSKRG